MAANSKGQIFDEQRVKRRSPRRERYTICVVSGCEEEAVDPVIKGNPLCGLCESHRKEKNAEMQRRRLISRRRNEIYRAITTLAGQNKIANPNSLRKAAMTLRKDAEAMKTHAVELENLASAIDRMFNFNGEV